MQTKKKTWKDIRYIFIHDFPLQQLVKKCREKNAPRLFCIQDVKRSRKNATSSDDLSEENFHSEIGSNESMYLYQLK